MGAKGLFTKYESITIHGGNSILMMSSLNAFYQGLLGNLLNPKTIMFLLSFFTLIVKPGDTLLLEMDYGLEIALIHMLWFSSLAYLMTLRVVKSNLNRVQYYVAKAMGAVLVIFGIRICALAPATTLPVVLLD